jgi:hypothetical protein
MLAQGPGRRSSYRTIGEVCVLPLLVVLSWGVLALLDAEELNALTAVVWLLPVALYAAVVFRLWTLVLPLAWSTIVLGAIRLVDLVTGGCSVCGYEEDWSNYPILFLLFCVIPLTVAAAIGLAGGVIARAMHRRST